MALTTTMVSLGGARVLVSTPNVRQYGHLGLEILMSLASARNAGASVYFVRPPVVAGESLFELESPEVRVLRPSRLTSAVLHLRVAARGARARWGKWWDALNEAWHHELSVEFTTHIANRSLPEPIRDRIREARRQLRVSSDEILRVRAERPSYFQRALLRPRIPVHLRAEAEAGAAREAVAHGIDPQARLVCIHARESGYKLGKEMQDAKPHAGRDDRVRNARIETYLHACDYLIGLGYTVVRLGDPSMTPLQHPGVVDLATSPARTNRLEVHCLLRSDLIIANESGLAGVGYLTNTPMLLVNVTEPIAAYPIRAPGLFLTKGVVERRTGRRLTNLELLTDEYQSHFRDSRRYLYVDNDPEEITAAVVEMLDYAAGTWTESAGQRAYHTAIIDAISKLQKLNHVRKWGLDGEFLGDGRIAKVAVEAVPGETVRGETVR
jgi:putative glycosyltransferase (TIGR04372 family)